MSGWQPADLPRPGSREYNAQLAEVLRLVMDGKVTAYPPKRDLHDEWSFFADGEDVTGEVIGLIIGGLLVGDWSCLTAANDVEEWLAEVAP